MLLGDVREVEVDRERPQDDRLASRPGAQRSVSASAARSRCVAASPEPGEPADPLLEPEGLLAFLLDEHATERVAEQPDVRAERGRATARGRSSPHSRNRVRYAAAPKRFSARARAFAASTSRSRGGAVRDEVLEEVRGDVGDLVDRPREDRFVGLRRLRRAAHLAHVLERRGADLVVGRARLEVVERLMFLHMRRA